MTDTNASVEQACDHVWEAMRPIGGTFWHELDERTRTLAVACYKAALGAASTSPQPGVKAHVKRNVPGHSDSGGSVVVPFATDNEMRAILSALEPASTNGAMIETRNEEAGFVEFLNYDAPTIVRDIPGPCAILLDMNTRQTIGYRVYDPGPAEPDGWYPIETALLGAEIIVWERDYGWLLAMKQHHDGVWTIKSSGNFYGEMPASVAANLTHWRHIGNPPGKGPNLSPLAHADGAVDFYGGAQWTADQQAKLLDQIAEARQINKTMTAVLDRLAKGPLR
jgi:hypothetical protein